MCVFELIKVHLLVSELYLEWHAGLYNFVTETPCGWHLGAETCRSSRIS